MSRTIMASIFASFLCLLPASTIEGTHADQVAVGEETFTLNLSGGLDLEKFAAEFARMTKRRIFFDHRRVQNKRITGFGEMTFKVSDAERVFRNILFINDMAVLEMGDLDLRMLRIEDIHNSQILKQSAKAITLDELARNSYASEIVAVVVPVKFTPVDKIQRAINNLMQDHRSGFVHPLQSAKAVVVTSFGGRVRNIVKLIAMIDEQAALNPPVPMSPENAPKESKSSTGK